MFDDILFPIIKDFIVADLDIRAHEVVLHIDEKVLSNRGERQINLFPGSLDSGPSEDQHEGQEYYSGFNVGITRRIGKSAPDRIWENGYVNEVLVMLRGILWSIRKHRWEIIHKVNTALSDQPTPESPSQFRPWKLVEPYLYSGDSAEVQMVGPDHFNSDITPSHDMRQEYGIFARMRYSSARYMANAHPSDIPSLAVVSAFTPAIVDAQVTFTSAGLGEAPLSYLWTFGDGTTSTAVNPVHQYALSGTFTVTLTVTSGDLQQALSTQTVTVVSAELDLDTLTMAELDALTMDELDDMTME